MLTEKKDLRTGTSVWNAYRVPRVTPTRGNMKNTDVAVIGAGISGAMIAEELCDAGLSVVILDRRGPMKGSTTATTALIQYEIDTPLIHLQKKIGIMNAARAWRRSKLGLESLAAKIDALEIACEFDRRPSLYLAGNVLSATELHHEKRMRASIGLPTTYLSRKKIHDAYGISRAGALLTSGSSSLNPLHLAAGFLNAALAKGVTLYAPVEVLRVECMKKHNRLHLADGTTLNTRYVVFASGYEIPKMIKTRKYKVFSTWAIATKPQKAALWPDQAFIWESGDPYLYVRATPDGRVICGGEDEEFSDEAARDALLHEKIKTLQRKLKKLLPRLDTKADYAWTGSFGASTTGLPTIDVIPGYPRCYCAMAYGGNGITFSRIAAEVIRASITGMRDPDADLFAFD